MRFFTLPTCTVTYGSLVPLLSFAINPCAQITAKIIVDEIEREREREKRLVYLNVVVFQLVLILILFYKCTIWWVRCFVFLLQCYGILFSFTIYTQLEFDSYLQNAFS